MKDVDAAIVLAVDISQSIDRENAMRQKQGHVDALRSRQLVNAIKSGPHGCIAITYVEWASSGSLQTVLPWTLICDSSQAMTAADQIDGIAFNGFSRRSDRRTSLSYAIDASSLLLEQFPTHASRKVIDISSNGTNNDGMPVAGSRLRALGRGHIINGIVLALREPGVTDNLPGYFRDNIIGGPGAFVIAPRKPADYSTALLRKLVLEIAGIAGEAHLE
ncbi:MAG: hypothetical protein JWM58_2131 [Rhizobium sp.]|nr:hypothetical protein [Rhizobium sp.]